MIKRTSKNDIRVRIHTRIRRKVKGSPERPRLAVYRSLNHIYAQIIDDRAGRTMASASTAENGGNVAAAKAIGALVARRALDQGITQVVFDRGGYLYHGRIKALADAAREAGLKF